MSTVGGIRSAIGAIVDESDQASAAITQAIDIYERAQSRLIQEMQETGQGDVAEAVGIFAGTLDHLRDALGVGRAGVRAAEAVAARL
ncbi:MAG: hypothetical protein ACRDQH_04670 [Pseudonocardiaceae bacterium]